MLLVEGISVIQNVFLLLAVSADRSMKQHLTTLDHHMFAERRCQHLFSLIKQNFSPDVLHQ